MNKAADTLYGGGGAVVLVGGGGRYRYGGTAGAAHAGSSRCGAKNKGMTTGKKQPRVVKGSTVGEQGSKAAVGSTHTNPYLFFLYVFVQRK
ncbi:hypothetical protein RHMOL_Rhmol08G0168000 [Rhododendron molle]|uniref:Uncharacterized protein n=1 Tax=Rhododendron molle TaxID=49168 RepID=A0ACC0MP54_RHOML|nr:hypothetical protein RHMOL_Rhmol08G0168000 [Rhododendron molle]